MYLSDRDIENRLQNGSLEIAPLTDKALQIQPASVDLRLSDEFIHDSDTFTTDDLVLYPDEFVLGSTIERIKIPNDLVGHVEGRSSLGRLGVIIHCTAGFIDPGFHGQITLEICNLGHEPVTLSHQMRISQLTLSKLTSECERPYGTDRDSKYQDQTGVEPSKLKDDSDYRSTSR